MYGEPIALHLDGNTHYTTTVGSICSIMTYIIIFVALYFALMRLFDPDSYNPAISSWYEHASLEDMTEEDR